jgi:cellulose synthase/poly-beta-1,6-N-acetylglucosamine synthase-like glycosyltransferase
MNRVAAAPFELLLGLLALLTLWALAATTPALTTGLGVALPVIVGLVLVPDFVDLAIRLGRRRYLVQSEGLGLAPGPSTPLDVGDFTPYQKRLHLRPYAIVVSVHDLEPEMTRFLKAFEEFKDRLWVVDDSSTDGTAERLSQAGIRCLRGTVNRRKPGAIRELLAHLPPSVESVVVVDPDTRFVGGPAELEVLLFDFQRSGMDAFTPRIDVRKDGLVASLQRFEYFVSLSIGRKSLGDYAVNSGVSVYRRRALQGALDLHSLSVYAEDLETSLILLAAGGRIYYDDRARFESEAKRTWTGLFAQRVGWSYGLIRTYVGRFRDIRRVARRGPMAAYQFLVYFGLLNLLLQPVRLVALVPLTLSLGNGIGELSGAGLLATAGWAHPGLFLGMYGGYLVLALVALFTGVPREARLELLPMVPLYAFYVFFLVVPISIGYLNWISVRLLGRRLYRDHYQDEASLLGEVHGSRNGSAKTGGRAS